MFAPEASRNLNELNESKASELEDEELKEKREPGGAHNLMKKNYPMDKVVGDIKENVKTRSFYQQRLTTLISQMELSNINKALEDDLWSKPCKKSSTNFRKMMCGCSWNCFKARTSLEKNGSFATS